MWYPHPLWCHLTHNCQDVVIKVRKHSFITTRNPKWPPIWPSSPRWFVKNVITFPTFNTEIWFWCIFLHFGAYKLFVQLIPTCTIMLSCTDSWHNFVRKKENFFRTTTNPRWIPRKSHDDIHNYYYLYIVQIVLFRTYVDIAKSTASFYDS